MKNLIALTVIALLVSKVSASEDPSSGYARAYQNLGYVQNRIFFESIDPRSEYTDFCIRVGFIEGVISVGADERSNKELSDGLAKISTRVTKYCKQ